MSDQLPKAVSESTLTIGMATIRVTQLDNGMRCLDAGDVEKFFAGGGDHNDLAVSWATDTERELARVTADRDRLLAAMEGIRKEIAWLDKIDPRAIAIADYDGSASIIRACCDAALQQPQPEN